MLEPEVRDFLVEGRRIANLATVRRNGNPWLHPLWYSMRQDNPIIVPTTNSVATKSMRRQGRATLGVNDDSIPYRLATLECVAEIHESDERVRDYLEELIAKYRPTINSEQEVENYLEVGCVAVTLHLQRIHFSSAVVEVQTSET